MLAGIVSLGPLRGQQPSEQEAAEAAEFNALLEHLIRPLQPELVRKAVHHPRVLAPDVAQRLVLHLTVHRGAAAADGLLVLATHYDPAVRAAALRSMASLGMRSTAVRNGVRAALQDVEPLVRHAAIRALGEVGEAKDVDALIELMRSEMGVLRTRSFRALRSLTGVRTGKDWQSWKYWWSHARNDLAKRIDAAIHRLGEGGTAVQLVDARRVLARWAWFAPRKLEETVLEWLVSGEARLRSEGLRLVAAARLASLAGDVAMLLENEVEPEVVRAGRDCAAVLGIRARRPFSATSPR